MNYLLIIKMIMLLLLVSCICNSDKFFNFRGSRD